MQEKFNPLGEKFIEALHKKRAETESDYTDENPTTAEEVIDDLKEIGVVKEEVEIKEEKEKEKEKRLGKMAELAIESAFGKGVFEKEEIESPKEKSKEKIRQKPYIYREIDRLGKELVKFSKKAGETKNMEAKKVYEEKARFLRTELEKAKAARDKIKEEKKVKEVKKEIRPQLQTDIGESQPKTYGGKVYSRENFPEDHAKF